MKGNGGEAGEGMLLYIGIRCLIDIIQIGFYELIALANGGTFESRKNELLDYRMMTNRWIAQCASFRASR